MKQKIILPQSVTQRNICLYIHNNHFCVIRKRNRSTFPDAIKELEKNLDTKTITFLTVEEYKFPKSNGKNCMYAVFALYLETCNVEKQLYCEAYAAVFIIFTVYMNFSMVI